MRLEHFCLILVRMVGSVEILLMDGEAECKSIFHETCDREEIRCETIFFTLPIQWVCRKRDRYALSRRVHCSTSGEEHLLERAGKDAPGNG